MGATNTMNLKDQKILVIMGKAGAGKDTFARMVNEFLFGSSRCALSELKFSQTLKDVCCDLFGWDRSRMDELEYKEELFEKDDQPTRATAPGRNSDWMLRSRREVLQYLGTDIFRDMDKDIWVKAAIRRAKLTSITLDGFVSTDCRFPNEQLALTKEFGQTYFVKLHRAGEAMTQASRHSSEDLDKLAADVEFHVQSGDMDQMRRCARMVAQDFFVEDF